MGGFQGSAKFPGLYGLQRQQGRAGLRVRMPGGGAQRTHRCLRQLPLPRFAVDTDMLRAAFPGYQAPDNSR
jgi:hypothetical protein